MNLDRVQWGQRESEGEENVTLWLTHPPHNPPPPEKKLNECHRQLFLANSVIYPYTIVRTTHYSVIFTTLQFIYKHSVFSHLRLCKKKKISKQDRIRF